MSVEYANILLISIFTSPLIYILVVSYSIPVRIDFWSSFGNKDPKPRFARVSTARVNDVAYVLYATSKPYICYAAVNIGRLLHTLNVSQHVDIVLIVSEHLFHFAHNYNSILSSPRVRIMSHARPRVHPHSSYYRHVFMKLAVFELYDDYRKLLYLDADGLVLRNMDHLLLNSSRPPNDTLHRQQPRISSANTNSLHHYAISMPYCHNLATKGRWLCSCIFVAELSFGLNAQIQALLTPNGLQTLNNWVSTNNLQLVSLNRDSNDMELLNYLLARGAKANILPYDYLRWDEYFKVPEISRSIVQTYYVHFEYRNKPHLHPHRKASTKSVVFTNIYKQFWTDASLYCKIDWYND